MSAAEIRAFVFTDLVGSTRLKKQMPGRDSAERNSAFALSILRPHRARIEAALQEYDGRVISTQGDGHFLEFRSPVHAVMWAVDVQQRHRTDPIETPDGGRLGVKIGIHMGPASADPNETGNYVGTSVDYAARLVHLGATGTIYVSETVATFVHEEEMDRIDLHRHGSFDLAGIGEKVIVEVLYDGSASHRPQGAEISASSRSSDVALTQSALTALELREGVRIRDYELLEQIGEGGMGKVFKARHVGMGRICVLKLIKDTLLQRGSDEILDRFYQEIQVVARLHHPNIVAAYHSSSRDDAVHFLVMEYIEGQTLDRRIEAGTAIPMPDACEIVRQSAQGLQYIHENGLVHRDIKPSNLIIASAAEPGSTPSGRIGAEVKILDLGLALLVDDTAVRITQAGRRAMGTAYYMAPEQWASSSVDIRADIYALGGTFFHMLAGRPPFQDSEFSQEHAHRHVALVRPTTGVPLPDSVWAVVQKMMHKDPAQRFATPSEVVAAVARLAEGHSVGLLGKPTRRPSTDAASQTPSHDRDVTRDLTPDAGSSRQPPVAGPWAIRPWRLGRRTFCVVAAGTVMLVAGVWAARRKPSGQQRVLEVPGTRAAATHFLLTLPGMNGGWWFDEIPWFSPEMRQHLLHQLTVDEYLDLTRLAQQPDVDLFYDRLQALCQRSLRVERDGTPIVSDAMIRRFEELKDAQPFDEVTAGSAETSPWGRVDALLALESTNASEPNAADRHLRALLHWKMQQPDAQQLLREARDAYHTESKELKALCIADTAWIMQRLRRWREASKDYQSARATIPSIRLAPALTYFTYAMEAESRLFDRSKPRKEIPQLFERLRTLSFANPLAEDHPLQALRVSREALYYLETWQLTEAERKGSEAYAMFAQQAGNRRAANLAFRSRQFMALAHHFLGKTDQAQNELQELLVTIDRLVTSDDIADQAKPKWERLRPNLLGRLADCLLFGKGDAREAAAILDRAAEEAERFRGGPKTAYLARIQFKRAIAYALAGDTAAARQAWDAGQQVAESVPSARQQAVFVRFRDVAAALLLPNEGRAAALTKIVEASAPHGMTTSRLSRDDLQLLLLVCELLMRTAATDPAVVDVAQRKQIHRHWKRLSEPLARSGPGYLQRLRDAAARLLPSPSDAERGTP